MDQVSGAPDASRWRALAEHRDRAIRVARAAGLTLEEAEDCAHDALLRLAALPDVDTETLPGFVSAVTRNLAMDHHRRSARGHRLGRRLACLEPVVAPDPAEDLCDQLEGAWLRTQCKDLNPRQRRVLEARAAGLSPTEASRVLAMTPKSVEGAYRLARRSLQHRWRETLTALGLLAFGRRGWRLAAAPAAVTLVALVVPLTWVSPPAQGPTTAQRPEPYALEHAVSRAYETPTTAASDVPAVTETGTHAVSVGASDSRGGEPVAPRVTIGDEDTGTWVAVQRRTEDESFEDSVQRCVRNGWWVTVESQRCRDDGEPSMWPGPTAPPAP